MAEDKAPGGNVRVAELIETVDEAIMMLTANVKASADALTAIVLPEFPKGVQDFLQNYRGPYPLHQLRRARDTLIYGFNTYNSQTFHRLYKLMYMENLAAKEANWEYSEDEYSESESEAELVINANLEPKSPVKSKTQPERETGVSSKGGKSKSEVQPETSNDDKPFISRAGFKNRFAQQLLGNEAVDVLKKKALDKNLFGTDVRKVEKQPGSKAITIHFKNGDGSAENGDTDDDYCHSGAKKAKTTSSDLAASKKDLVEGFKCDYCNFSSLMCDEMYLHLEKAQHQYASRCRGDVEGGTFTSRYIVKEMCLQSYKKHSTKLATCPKCFLTFTDIYACTSHSAACSNKTNKNLDGCYAISDVVRDVNILIPVDSVCQTCKLKCSKHRALNTHYESCQHYPYDKPISADILLAFICPYCQKDFDNFFTAKAHVITHAVKHPRVSMALQLIYYKKTKIGHKILPRQQLPVKTRVSIKSTKRKKNRNFE